MLTDIYDRVKAILAHNDKARDDDMLLLSIIWEEDFKAKGTWTENIFIMIRNGELTHFESVRRSRQKAQELIPELQGLKYQKRKSLEEPVKKELKLISVEERFGHKKLVHKEGDLFPEEV